MKGRNNFFLVFTGFVFISQFKVVAGQEVRTVWFHQVPRVSQAPVIDGRPDDPCWKELPVLTNFGRDRYSLKSTHPLVPMRLQLGYDQTYLYCLWRMANAAGEYRVDYGELKKKQQEAMYNSAMYWNQPSVEFRIDGRHDRHGETMIQMNLIGQKEAFQKIATGWSTEYTEGWDIWADYTYVPGYDENSWWVELKVSLKDLNAEARPGYIMGAQFRYFHKPGVYFAWTPAGYETAGYGDLVLVEKPLPMDKALKLICPEYETMVIRMPQPDKVVVVEKGKVYQMDYRETFTRDWKNLCLSRETVEKLLLARPALQKDRWVETMRKEWENLEKEIASLPEVGAAEMARLKQPMETLNWLLEEITARIRIQELVVKPQGLP
ncbi:MAG TPA: hypothetical protein PKX93_01460 [bacterium]|nr:hypothetical protein [bacterium]HPP11215.1 hypothetical protein [bacterium]